MSGLRGRNAGDTLARARFRRRRKVDSEAYADLPLQMIDAVAAVCAGRASPVTRGWAMKIAVTAAMRRLVSFMGRV